EVTAGHVFEDFQEILDCRGLTVVAFEIKVHAPAKLFYAKQRADHSHDLRSLFIDGRRVEIVDLPVAPWPHRMGERPLILGKLMRTQGPHLGDAFDGARALISGKLMVPVNGQPFLQAKLKPVAASDSVSGPIVEILM